MFRKGTYPARAHCDMVFTVHVVVVFIRIIGGLDGARVTGKGLITG